MSTCHALTVREEGQQTVVETLLSERSNEKRLAPRSLLGRCSAHCDRVLTDNSCCCTGLVRDVIHLSAHCCARLVRDVISLKAVSYS